MWVCGMGREDHKIGGREDSKGMNMLLAVLGLEGRRWLEGLEWLGRLEGSGG